MDDRCKFEFDEETNPMPPLDPQINPL